jgi:hypothetical protein
MLSMFFVPSAYGEALVDLRATFFGRVWHYGCGISYKKGTGMKAVHFPAFGWERRERGRRTVTVFGSPWRCLLFFPPCTTVLSNGFLLSMICMCTMTQFVMEIIQHYLPVFALLDERLGHSLVVCLGSFDVALTRCYADYSSLSLSIQPTRLIDQRHHRLPLASSSASEGALNEPSTLIKESLLTRKKSERQANSKKLSFQA